MNRTDGQIRELARIVFDFYSDTSDPNAKDAAKRALDVIDPTEAIALSIGADVAQLSRGLVEARDRLRTIPITGHTISFRARGIVALNELIDETGGEP